MKFRSFTIKNYRGINEARIVLDGNRGSIYTLVGLNESGKTTILEAINGFRHDVDGVHAMAQKAISDSSVESLVPKKSKDNFNGRITISAEIEIAKEEIEALNLELKSELDFVIDVETFPETFLVTRTHVFEASALQKSSNLWNLYPSIKKGKARKARKLEASNEEWQEIVRKISKNLPRILYFPTFLFDFPERIEITPGVSDIEGNEYFRRVVIDALRSLDDPLDLDKHIVDRILKLEEGVGFINFFSAWLQSDKRERVNAALSRLSRKITHEVFGRWREVLGSDIWQ